MAAYVSSDYHFLALPSLSAYASENQESPSRRFAFDVMTAGSHKPFFSFRYFSCTSIMSEVLRVRVEQRDGKEITLDSTGILRN